MSRDVRQYSSDEFEYYVVSPFGWPVTVKLPVIRRKADNTFYWPVAAICEDVLTIQTSRQLQKIKSNSKTLRFIREFDVRTRAGMRKTTFLEFEGLGPWFDTIQTQRMQNAELAALLDKFQAAAVRAVNDILWGHNPPVPPQLAAPGAHTLTLADTQAYVQFVEGRVETIEDRMFRQPYINEYDEDGAGIINIPFIAPSRGRFIIRLRQQPWQAPEVIDILPADDDRRDRDDQ